MLPITLNERARMHLAWMTDLHLNFVEPASVAAFHEVLRSQAADGFLVGGDVSEAGRFDADLREIAAAVDRPVFFVLGNHDYYHGSIADVRRRAGLLHAQDGRLVWLPQAGVVPLTDRTALVGHGGWGDARAGNFLQSNVMLNDYLLIEELVVSAHRGHWSPADWETPELRCVLQRRLRQLGDEAADHFRQVLPLAFSWAERVVVLMHVPPFREACVHQGRVSNDDWSPHFTCVAAGEALREIMRDHPRKRMTVLCGHTHGSGHAQILDNLEVFTGGAEYTKPAVQSVLVVN